MPALTLNGIGIFPGWLDADAQADLVDTLRGVVVAAPLFTPETRWGKPMSVRMTAAGRFGWYSDRRGYRYIETHPVTGRRWPAIPPKLLDIWAALCGGARLPECCLVNFYGTDAKMGLHQDRDEADLIQPVLSISLGDDALFRVGGTTRGGKTQSAWLRSGDIALIAGPGRLAYHGIDRIRPGSSTLLKDGGRINLTLRVVT